MIWDLNNMDIVQILLVHSPPMENSLKNKGKINKLKIKIKNYNFFKNIEKFMKLY